MSASRFSSRTVRTARRCALASLFAACSPLETEDAATPAAPAAALAASTSPIGLAAPPQGAAGGSARTKDESSESFVGTIGSTDVPRAAQSPATVVDVRSGKHVGFDRFVWQFDRSVPGYHIEYIDKPVRQCGSGEATPIAGDAWIEIRIEPSYAHTERGASTVEREQSALGLDVALELERTCDFEAVTTWVIGVRSPNSYRAFELRDPPRLVVDLEHRGKR